MLHEMYTNKPNKEMLKSMQNMLGRQAKLKEAKAIILEKECGMQCFGQNDCRQQCMVSLPVNTLLLCSKWFFANVMMMMMTTTGQR